MLAALCGSRVEPHFFGSHSADRLNQATPTVVLKSHACPCSGTAAYLPTT